MGGVCISSFYHLNEECHKENKSKREKATEKVLHLQL